MSGSTSSAEVSHRISKVASALLDGASRAEVVEMASKEWQVSASTADRYARAARKEVAEACEADVKARLGIIEGRLNRLYGVAVADGDVRTALSVTKAQMGLYGLTRGVQSEGDEYDPWASYYASMAAFSMREYARALAKALTREQADAVLAEARSVGAAYDLSGLVEDSRRRIEEDERRDALLLQCVRDHEELGRGRTRQELIDAGLIPAECGGGDDVPDADDGLEELLRGTEALDLD